jgi:hypothetical protein
LHHWQVSGSEDRCHYGKDQALQVNTINEAAGKQLRAIQKQMKNMVVGPA